MSKIFISYSRSDSQFAEQFVSFLRHPHSEYDVWYDQNIIGGIEWWKTILENIADCDLFVYLVSNDSLESPYCQAEFREALRLNKLFLPLIIKPRPDLRKAPDDIERKLRGTQWINISRLFTNQFSTVSEPTTDSINVLLNQATTQEVQPPLSDTPTVEPFVNDLTIWGKIKNFGWQRVAIGFLVIFLIPLFIAVVGGLVQTWPAIVDRLSSNETPTSQPVVSAPTDNLTATMEVVETENAHATNVRATVDSVNATNIANTQQAVTATMQAVETENAHATNVRATVDSINTTNMANTQQAATNTQAWIDSWTDTPTATHTPVPPAPTTEAFQQAQQRANSGVNSNTGWQTWYPRGFVWNFDGVEMVLVPKGCFTIGSSDGYDDELNGNNICFEEPFWIDKYEVTNELYGPIDTEGGTCTTMSSTSNQPRICVSWFDANTHCEARNARLPTEAEWEFAARGPDELVYPWGNTYVAENVIDWNDPTYGSTSPALVGSRSDGASWVGAMDMSGNVWEWTHSLYEAYPYNSEDGRESDTGDSTDVLRVLRGGAFLTPEFQLTYRYAVEPDNGWLDLVGFRCVRSLNP